MTTPDPSPRLAKTRSGHSRYFSFTQTRRLKSVLPGKMMLGVPQTKTMFVEDANRFFNKGVNGRWRLVLGSTELALYESKVQAKLSPSLAACSRAVASL